MPRPVVCVACDKDNHRFCLGRAHDGATGNNIDCQCGICDNNQLREEQTYGGDRRGRDHT